MIIRIVVSLLLSISALFCYYVCSYVCHRVLDESPEFAIEHMQIEPLIAVL